LVIAVLAFSKNWGEFKDLRKSTAELLVKNGEKDARRRGSQSGEGKNTEISKTIWEALNYYKIRNTIIIGMVSGYF